MKHAPISKMTGGEYAIGKAGCLTAEVSITNCCPYKLISKTEEDERLAILTLSGKCAGRIIKARFFIDRSRATFAKLEPGLNRAGPWSARLHSLARPPLCWGYPENDVTRVSAIPA